MYDRDDKIPSVKLASIQYVILLIIAILVVRLWNLQVRGSEKYSSLAEQNRIRKTPVLAPRGKIFDREGRILVDNYPSVECFLLREQVKDLAADIPLIARGLHMQEQDIRSVLRRYQAEPKYEAIPLKQDITP